MNCQNPALTDSLASRIIDMIGELDYVQFCHISNRNLSGDNFNELNGAFRRRHRTQSL